MSATRTVYPTRSATVAAMGKSGMKRKGRSHLPKAGTRPANEQLLHHERAGASHPFSSDPSRRGGAGYGIMAVVVAVVVLIGIIALITLT
jgi:hypothetical protein